MSNDISGLAFIGFGEAAEAISTGWGKPVAARATAFDIKTARPETAASPRERAARAGVRLLDDRAATLAGASAVFCLVTADQAETAAGECAPLLARGAFWFDGNSCSPGAKRRAAARIEAAGGRYVDVAIMAPVYPKLHKVPLLIAGPHAEAAAHLLAGLGMNARIMGDAVGDASTIKMLRSVMIKGMEALSAECFLAARRAGVEDKVLASLTASNPETDWPVQGAYNLERMMVHGRRRAAEMREVAVTLAELGLPNGLAAATVDWQQRIGDLGLDPGADSLTDRADAVLKRI